MGFVSCALPGSSWVKPVSPPLSLQLLRSVQVSWHLPSFLFSQLLYFLYFSPLQSALTNDTTVHECNAMLMHAVNAANG
jgi:hypothetical protein